MQNTDTPMVQNVKQRVYTKQFATTKHQLVDTKQFAYTKRLAYTKHLVSTTCVNFGDTCKVNARFARTGR